MIKASVEFEDALLSVDRTKARDIIDKFTKTHGEIEAVEQVIVPALEKIGYGWEQGKVALAQVYMSGRISEDLTNAILPQSSKHRRSQPKMAIAVLEDYHNLGKSIVSAVLQSRGYELLDYGHGIGVEELFDLVKRDNVEILLISVLMLHSALLIKDLTEKVRESGMSTRIIVGGAPFRFDKQLWQEVGAYAMAASSSDILQIIEQLMEDI